MTPERESVLIAVAKWVWRFAAVTAGAFAYGALIDWAAAPPESKESLRQRLMTALLALLIILLIWPLWRGCRFYLGRREQTPTTPLKGSVAPAVLSEAAVSILCLLYEARPKSLNSPDFESRFALDAGQVSQTLKELSKLKFISEYTQSIGPIGTSHGWVHSHTYGITKAGMAHLKEIGLPKSEPPT